MQIRLKGQLQNGSKYVYCSDCYFKFLVFDVKKIDFTVKFRQKDL